MTLAKPMISNDLIDALMKDYRKPEDLIGADGILKQLTQRIVERALQAEMTEHLGHGKHQLVENDAGNTRNGKSTVGWGEVFRTPTSL